MRPALHGSATRQVLTALVLLVIASSTSCARERPSADSRAYPDSDPDITLARALKDHHLQLPPSVTDIRFGAYTPRNYGLYLTFRVACDATSMFLDGSEVKSKLISNNIPSAIVSIGRRYDWSLASYSRPRGVDDVLGKIDRSVLIVNVDAQKCQVFVVSYV
jgi:hypothetical protein